MTAPMEMLRMSEAAVISGITLRDVNRAIDEGILPAGFFSVENGRHVVPAACMVMSFYFSSARSLTAEERVYAIKAAEPRLRDWHVSRRRGESWTVRHEFLTIDFAPFAERIVARLDRLAAAREIVESSPEILGGTPVIRGTRIPVHDLAASISMGDSVERVLAAYPGLDGETLELAALYAEAYPMRGRPRGAGELPKGAVIISDRRVPRHRRAG